MSLPLADTLMGTSPASEFQNYLFFLYHFRELVRRQRGTTMLDILKCIATEQAPRFAKVVPRPLNGKDHTTIRKYLFTAWNAEAVSRLPAGFDPEVLQFTNQWKPVQAYYAIYFHLVTLHFVVNAIVPKHHEPTLRYATQTILPWFPQPWCLRFNHNTTTLDEFPPGTPITSVDT